MSGYSSSSIVVALKGLNVKLDVELRLLRVVVMDSIPRSHWG